MEAPAQFPDDDPPPPSPLLAFETAMIPGDINIWNYFTMFPTPEELVRGAVLSLRFRNDDGGSVPIDARILSFVVVPEPSCQLLLVTIFLLAAAKSQRTF